MALGPEEARRLAAVLLDDAADGDEPLVPTLPRAFGRYRIVRLVGVGGMGEVYEAQQDHPARRVALKVIRPELVSGELVRRLEHEARVLGKLQHPGIAQIYEAGRAETAAGPTPYFAMEFVEGLPLTRYAQERRLGVRERLGLFLKVCEAVEHAHRKGIIHRDLKPGNILVAAGESGAAGADAGGVLGQPRVLDFGVARATDADVRATTVHTEIGKLVGTLPYMSPEQVGGDPDATDTRSDVYSLGVVLYELLGDRPPYEIKRGLVHEAARVIREEEPAPLSSIDRVFRGDLETIVAKALAKEKERRYQSVGELAADIRRYLNDEPIVARPASAWYQVRKFARRNQTLSMALGVVAISLAASSAVTVVFAYRERQARLVAEMAAAAEAQAREAAEQNEREALRQRQSATAVTQFLTQTLGAASPSRQGPSVTVRDAFESGMAKIDATLGHEPSIHAAVRAAAGEVYFELGEYDRAFEEHARALDLLKQAGLDGTPEAIGAIVELGWIRFMQGDRSEAAAYAAKAAELAERAGSPAQRQLLRAANIDAMIKRWSQQEEQAAVIFHTLLKSARTAFGEDDADTLMYLNNYADALRGDRRFSEAEPLFAELVERRAKLFGREDLSTLIARENLANLLADMGRHEAALNEYEAVLKGRIAALGSDHPATIMTRNNIAVLLLDTGDSGRGLPMLREVVRMSRTVNGDAHPNTLTSITTLAHYAHTNGDIPEAIRLLEEVCDARRRAGGMHDLTAALNNLCQVLVADRQFSSAEPLFAELLAIAPKVFPESDWRLAVVRTNYAACLAEVGRPHEAEALCLAAYEVMAAEFGPRHERAVQIARQLARLYQQTGRTEDAKTWLARQTSEFMRGE